jgi:dihydrofolate reductase
MICAIGAMSRNRVIGRKGDLPWHLPSDLKRVAKLTMGHILLMGRVTYFSIPPKFRPLSGRTSLIVSSSNSKELISSDVQHASTDGQCVVVPSVTAALDWYRLNKTDRQLLWIFGGGTIYQQTQHLWDEVYLTLVDIDIEGDTYFPAFESEFVLSDSQEELSKQEGHEIKLNFLHYKRNIPQ